MKNDRDIAEELFGSTRRIRATSDHKVNALELIKPLKWEKGVMYFFCKGCGTVVEINRRFAECIANSLKIKLPDDPKQFCIKSERCGYCDSKDNSLELLPIPQIDA